MGKHVATREPIYWRFYYRQVKNRWYAFIKPRWKRKIKELYDRV